MEGYDAISLGVYKERGLLDEWIQKKGEKKDQNKNSDRKGERERTWYILV